MDTETDISPEPVSAASVIAPRQKMRLSGLLRTFSPAERLLLYGLTVLLGISAFVLLADMNKAISTEVPTHGGSLVEGAVGTPRFVNPLLDASQTDEDLTTLVYSGLLRPTKDGYVPDLADRYEISADGTVYTFHLRHDLTFHDGQPLTSADVLFTIALAQNPEIKSVRRADWEGVSASAPDAYTVVFTLPHAYAPFRENATLGIVPKHLWQNVAAEEFPFSSLNTHPVGSGPYKIDNVVMDTTGAPTQYTLRAFKHFALGEPNVTKLTYRVFPSDEELIAAYNAGDVESFVANSPRSLSRNIQDDADLKRETLARVFGVFFNQNHAAALTSLPVRRALDVAVDKEKIAREILGGYGVTLDGPIPPGLLPHEREEASSTNATSTVSSDRLQDARDILSRGGWKFVADASSTDPGAGTWQKDKQSLSLTLATADTEDLVATAHAVADAWQALGIPTTVQVYPLSEFNTTILRPRSYDAVLFGEVVGRSLDLFAFWHSSQRNDPGLNLALYTNAESDSLLASARAETDATKREEYIRNFLDALAKDQPAVFLYSPQLAYIVPSRLQGLENTTLTTPSDRFIDVYRWYRDTERVWNIFSH